MTSQTEASDDSTSGFDIAVSVLSTAETPPILDTEAQTLLSNVQDPYIDLDALVSMIEQQPALCARLLGIANSALYAPDPPIVSVSAAIIRVLGLDLTRGIVLGYIVRKTLPVDACLGFDNRRFWRASLKLARLAREFAALHQGADEDDVSMCYLSGLLHRVGLLVTAAVASDDLSNALSSEPDLRLRDRLLKQLGFHHLHATNAIADVWGVPRAVAVNLAEDSLPGQPAWYVERAKGLMDADDSGDSQQWETACEMIAKALDVDAEVVRQRYQKAELECAALASAF